MSCRQIRSWLSAYIDGDLGEAKARRVQEHLQRCEGCRRAADHLRLIVAEASNLEDLLPPPDLFDRVYAAVHRHGGSTGERSRRGGRWVWWALPASAAAAGLAALIVIGPWSSTSRSSRPSDSRASEVPDDTAALMESVTSEFRRAETHYQKAVSQLRKLAAEDSRSWPTGQRRGFENNMKIIDRAVERYRQAARLDPVDPHSREVLFAAYRRQIHFLQDAILAGASRDISPGGAAMPATWRP